MEILMKNFITPTKWIFLTAVFCISNIVQAQKVIKVDGSSTVFPITEAMAEEFQKTKSDVRVTVGISGTGGGFKKFCRGETDIQDASRPISKSEMVTCKTEGIKYMELPVAYDATVVVVNPGNSFLKEITVEELKKIWHPDAQGKIMKWSDVNSKWPAEKLSLYGAGSDSGTFDYFTEAICGKAKLSRGDYMASEDDNTLVTGVSKDKFALGYIPLSYYLENQKKLKAIAVISGNGGKAVLPSKATVEDGTYQPLSRPLFIYVSEKALSRPEIKEFTKFYIENSAAIVPEVKYVALPKAAYDGAAKHLATNKLGTVFGGDAQVGLRIEELLKREASF